MAVEIIAEAAQGYEGDPTLARLLARAAIRAGADAVKFQLVYADELATPDYQHYRLFRGLEMPREAWASVVRDVHEAKMRCYLDVFGERSLREAHALGIDGVKIHSTDFLNAPLVDQALELMGRVFVSFGGMTLEEFEAFLQRHRITPESPVCFLYGFQADPTAVEQNNLLRLGALQARFPGYRFGFMDHTDGDQAEAMTLPLLALPLGVCCIEKHIGLDRALQLEDYVSALPAERFQAFVRSVRRHEQALGTDRLELTETERAYRQKAIKAVVAHRVLKRGQALTDRDVCLKRSPRADGASLHRLEDVVGRHLAADVQPDHPITKDLLT